MTKTSIHCDCCGAEPAQELAFRFGTHQNAAGSVEADYKTIDLCPMHMRVVATMTLGLLDDEERRRVHSQLKRLV